jgi:integrase
VRFRRPDGAQASRTFQTKKLAEQFEATIVLDLDGSRTVTKQQRKTTFAEVTENWLRTKEHTFAATTKRRLEQILRLHLLPTLGNIPIRQITTGQMRELVSVWQRDGLAPLTIRNHIAIARPIFKFALEDGLLTKDPTTGLKLDSDSQRQPVILNEAQCQTLLTCLDDHHRRLFYVLLVTGLRINELINLKMNDVDFTNKVLRIRSSKTKRGIREIDLSANDLRVIREQIESNVQFRTDASNNLFQSQKGKPLHYRNLTQRVLKKVIAETGLPKFTFHDLRRTHATMLVGAGIDPKAVQYRMGHSSIETTLKYYAQATREGRDAAAEVAVRYLSSSPHENNAVFK